jgi:hypothetical protein
MTTSVMGNHSIMVGLSDKQPTLSQLPLLDNYINEK